MLKRAGVARAMALDPDILFFDEPSAGLDPISSRRLDDLILELRASLGATMVVVTHELPSIFAIADTGRLPRRRDADHDRAGQPEDAPRREPRGEGAGLSDSREAGRGRICRMSMRANPTVIGAFVVGAIALVLVALLVWGGTGLFRTKLAYVLFFDAAVTGLNKGAPVLARGVKVGEVTDVQLRWGTPIIAVYIAIEPEAVRGTAEAEPARSIEQAVREDGLRAQLRLQSFVTGVLYVALDFRPGTPIVLRGLDRRVPELPTIPTDIEVWTAKLERFADKIEKVPLDQIGQTMAAILEDVKKITASKETQDLFRNTNAAIADARTLVRRVDAQIDPLLAELKGTLARLDTSPGRRPKAGPRRGQPRRPAGHPGRGGAQDGAGGARGHASRRGQARSPGRSTADIAPQHVGHGPRRHGTRAAHARQRGPHTRAGVAPGLRAVPDDEGISCGRPGPAVARRLPRARTGCPGLRGPTAAGRRQVMDHRAVVRRLLGLTASIGLAGCAVSDPTQFYTLGQAAASSPTAGAWSARPVRRPRRVASPRPAPWALAWGP